MTFKEKHELENLNKRLPELEKEKSTLESKLNASSLDYNEILQLTEALGKLNQELESAELRWLELTEKA
jgi:ATP-binding cassette subfamily F protein uup